MTLQPSPSRSPDDPDACAEHDAKHSVAVLSSMALTLARRESGESRGEFAARARVEPATVNGVENGTRPAWVLLYGEFTALASAAGAPDPALGLLFETAAACDLLLSCVMNGDQALATDVLVEPRSRNLAKALLTVAVTGEPVSNLPVAGQVRPPEDLVLTGAQATLLCGRAAALAQSGSPDAWVGAEILAACRGRQS